MAKRMAIIQSGKFYVWSLTWKDVESAFQFQGEYYENYLLPSELFEKNLIGKKMYTNLINNYNISTLKINNKNSMQALLDYLQNPAIVSEIKKLIFAYNVSLSCNDTNDNDINKWINQCYEIIGNNINDLEKHRDQQMFFRTTKIDDETLQIYAAISGMDMALHNFDNPFSLIILEDRPDKVSEEFESIWNGYLNMFNLFQFKENSLFMTTKGIEKNLYNEFFKNENIIYEVKEEVLVNEYWEENKEYVDEIMNNLIKALVENNVDNPDEIGYELINEDEEVIALCEIAWINKKVAILTEEQEEFKETFNSNGWNYYIITQDETNFKEILEKLK